MPCSLRLGRIGSWVVHGETSSSQSAEAEATTVEAPYALFGAEAGQAALQSLSKVREPQTAAG